MSREIKFRAWLKDEKVMVDVEQVDFYNNTIAYIFDNYAEVEQEWIDNDIKNVVLMQYIGRCAENEDHIFNNDVVSVVVQNHVMGFYRETEYIGVVKYDEDECVYYLDLIKEPIEGGETIPDEIDGIPIITESDEETKRFYFSEYIVQEDIKILGNIYENPELLEVNND